MRLQNIVLNSDAINGHNEFTLFDQAYMPEYFGRKVNPGQTAPSGVCWSEFTPFDFTMFGQANMPEYPCLVWQICLNIHV